LSAPCSCTIRFARFTIRISADTATTLVDECVTASDVVAVLFARRLSRIAPDTLATFVEVRSSTPDVIAVLFARLSAGRSTNASTTFVECGITTFHTGAIDIGRCAPARAGKPEQAQEECVTDEGLHRVLVQLELPGRDGRRFVVTTLQGVGNRGFWEPSIAAPATRTEPISRRDRVPRTVEMTDVGTQTIPGRMLHNHDGRSLSVPVIAPKARAKTGHA
jgi:hypothetical protein